MTGTKLRVGIAGLGRMGMSLSRSLTNVQPADPPIGKRHAINFHELTPRAHVIVASTPDAGERKWGAENLEGVEIYTDYDEMLERDDLDAVVVASVTAVHAEQAIKAINKGYYVLCEKPLSIDIDVVCILPILGFDLSMC